MKKLISCLVIMFTLCSCGGQFYYVQVLNATCSNPSGRTDVSNPELAYSDDNCNIYYSFWGNGGDGGFVMYNKTDSIIFVDLTETFFIINGFSSPYYQARQWGESSTSTTQVSTNSSYAYSTSNTNASVFGRASASANAQATAFGNSAYGIANAIGNFSSFGTSTTNNTFHYRSFNVSNMHSVTYTQGESEMPILAIAPHSYGRASNGQIHNMLIKDCALNR